MKGVVLNTHGRHGTRQLKHSPKPQGLATPTPTTLDLRPAAVALPTQQIDVGRRVSHHRGQTTTCLDRSSGHAFGGGGSDREVASSTYGTTPRATYNRYIHSCCRLDSEFPRLNTDEHQGRHRQQIRSDMHLSQILIMASGACMDQRGTWTQARYTAQ